MTDDTAQARAEFEKLMRQPPHLMRSLARYSERHGELSGEYMDEFPRGAWFGFLAAWSARPQSEVVGSGWELQDRALIVAVQTWVGENEGAPRNKADAELLKAVWTYDGDRIEPCEGCDGECGEPCAPCTVQSAHAALDAWIAARAEVQS